MDYLAIAQQILDENYHGVGVRVVCNDESYNVGDDCRDSYEWDLESEMTTYDLHGEEGMKAGGTCALSIEIQAFATNDWTYELALRIEEAIKISTNTYGEGQQVIIAGNSGLNNDGYFDKNEIRIRNAYVIAVL